MIISSKRFGSRGKFQSTYILHNNVLLSFQTSEPSNHEIILEIKIVTKVGVNHDNRNDNNHNDVQKYLVWLSIH